VSALWALLGACAVLWVIQFLWRDAQRCKAARAAWRQQVTTLSVASRARSMEELPDEFMAELRQAMHLEAEEILG